MATTDTNINKFVDVEDWRDGDNLMLLECWSRDGYTFQDIANRIGITTRTLARWRDKFPEIATALRNGREIVDYKVENALLKSALGYKTKEVTVTTTLRNGRMVEETKQTVTREAAPNVSAIQTWLYNRCQGKWRNMNSRANLFDELSEDTNVSIVVTRAGKNATEIPTLIESESQQTTKNLVQNDLIDSGEDFDIGDDIINESVTVRGMSTEEKEKQRKLQKQSKAAKKTAESTKRSQTKIETDEWDSILAEEEEGWED